MSTLENLRKSARRWLKALHADDADAHARLRRAHPTAPVSPVLRDVQHALAREHGHESWIDLRRALDDGKELRATTPDVDQYDAVAKDVLAAYQAGDAAAMQRLQERFRRPVTWETLRAEVDHQIEQLPDTERPRAGLSLADIRYFMARSAGFESWVSFLDALRLDDEHAEANARVAVAVPRQPDPGPSGMLQPVELRITLPMELQGGEHATTTDVWHMLAASRAGDLERIKSLVAATPALVRCEHNYMPPLHLAVREGHMDLVLFLLERGAFDPEHVTYPYNETLLTIADDRDYTEISRLLREYADKPPTTGAGGEAVHGVGTIQLPADDDVNRLEKLVAANALSAVEKLLERHPQLVHYELACWAEGILSMPANRAHQKMLELLIRFGARVPDFTKWGRAYHFKHYDIAAFLLERGMNPNHMNWHRTTLLHDMAWEGDVRKAGLLLEHGADINAVDDEFRSTPLGVAARWGRREVGSRCRSQQIGRVVGDTVGLGNEEGTFGDRSGSAVGRSSLTRKTRVEGILAFAERILPRASDLWVQASLDDKQRLQQLFFPEGIAFDGNRFNRTTATDGSLLRCGRRDPEVGLPAEALGTEEVRRRGLSSHRRCGGQSSRERERRLVSQTFVSWNQIAAWLRRLERLQGAA